MADVNLKSLTKSFDNLAQPVVGDVSFTVKDREFMVLVGPSGCGKSTTLRMIAGLENPTSGTITIDGKDVTHIPPKDRDIAMVFQNYALYPHLNVYENLAFSLRIRKYPRAQLDEKVNKAASILGLVALLKRRPRELSGGQRQRVALGRAIVREPKVFLFDEPLSNLDAKLRVQMRTEILKLHKKLESTIIYVTHDQMEAMTMGDRIVILKDGRVQQIDKPLTLYNRPVNRFVAGFIGSPSMNFIDLHRDEHGFSFAGIRIPYPSDSEKQSWSKVVSFGVRPEKLCFSGADKCDITFKGSIEVSERMGHESLHYIRMNGQNLIVRELEQPEKSENRTETTIGFNLRDCHFFDEHGNAIGRTNEA